MMAWLSTLAGLGLLALAAVEVYATILHGRGRAGPVSEWINQTTWAAARAWTARCSRAERHRRLNTVGPLLMPMLVFALLALLLTGFALLYLPHMPGSFVFNPAIENEPEGVQAFYFSGVTLLTLGYGDIVPRTWPMRLVALGEAASGFGVISLAVTYLITVYGALERKRAVALSVYHQAREGADVARFVTHHFSGGEFRGLSDVMRMAARDLQGLLEAHLEHPVIHYFHPVEVHKGVPRILFIVLETAAVLRACVAAGESAPKVEAPDRQTLESSARYLLNTLCEALRLTAAPLRSEADARWKERFKRTLRALEEDGIRTSDHDPAWETYRKNRGEWEGSLRVFAEYLGYDWEEVAGDDSLATAAQKVGEEFE